MSEVNGYVILQKETGKFLNEFKTYVEREDAVIFRTYQAADQFRDKSKMEQVKPVVLVIDNYPEWMTRE